VRPPRSQILATGHYTPGVVLSNAELIERYRLPVDPAWIEERTGIRERHWAAEDECTSDLLLAAARAALAEADCDPRRLDRLLVATITPDLPSPATATIVARRLGARCPAVDLSAACAGFLYALELADLAVRAGEQRVLVLAGDTRSRFVDPADVRSVVLFADGAGAALLGPAEGDRGLLSVATGAEGRERMGAYVPAGGSARPASHATVEAREHFVQVDGRREIFDLFQRFTAEACTLALERAGLPAPAIDLWILHQGNARMVEQTLAHLGVDPAKGVNDVHRHGNTAGGTVAIALDEARRGGRIAPGSTVLLSAVGAGYTFGAAVHRF
jgi:3-oxoacyl-[acyl-carrier-protein] synthase-3